MAVANHEATTRPSPAAAEDLECLLEALLFLAPEPLAIPELVRLLQHGEVAIVATLRRLTRRYAKRGLRVKEQQGRYCLTVAPTAEKAVLAYHQEPGLLSDAAYEALALVAYLLPITASRLLELQGADGSHTLQTLQDAGLIVGTPGEESRLFFRTTEAFLTAAELTSLNELPEALQTSECDRSSTDSHGVAPRGSPHRKASGTVSLTR
jgi:segregation and condensation protein B